MSGYSKLARSKRLTLPTQRRTITLRSKNLRDHTQELRRLRLEREAQKKARSSQLPNGGIIQPTLPHRYCYTLLMWGRVILGAVIVTLTVLWLVAIGFLLLDPRTFLQKWQGGLWNSANWPVVLQCPEAPARSCRALNPDGPIDFDESACALILNTNAVWF
jgi:hypothetical protein